MKGQFAPIKSSFSQSFRVLIRDMLQRDPQYRPSAHEILYMRLPELMKKVSSDKVAGVTNMSKSSEFVEVAGSANGGGDKSVKRASSAANKRSLVFEFNLLTMKIEPVHFPFRVTIKQVISSLCRCFPLISSVLQSCFKIGRSRFGRIFRGKCKNRFEIIKAKHPPRNTNYFMQVIDCRISGGFYEFLNFFNRNKSYVSLVSPLNPMGRALSFV